MIIILYKNAMTFITGKTCIFRLDPFKRQFHTAPCVAYVGFLPRKTNLVECIHPKFNFSFILRGNGFLQLARKRHAVTAPCVITQVPGIRIRHGPDTEWDEVYFAYPKESVASFVRLRLFSPERPLWPIDNLPAIEKDMMTLREHLGRLNEWGCVDSIDWLCAGLIMKSQLHKPSHNDRSPAEPALCAIRTFLETHYREDIHIYQLVRDHGVSYSHFRRLWNRYFTCSPARYVMFLRIGEACRLLAEPSLRIGEIAATLGFKDPFHFSRRFHQLTGKTASEFRKEHYGLPPTA